jgi:hypothetical protein
LFLSSWNFIHCGKAWDDECAAKARARNDFKTGYMIKQFNGLTTDEKELLLHVPALVSVLAASDDKGIDKAGKADAIKLAHLKTFTATAVLLPYYNEAEIDFKKHFEEIVKQYAPFDDVKREIMQKKIESVRVVIAKLNKGFGQALYASFSKYSEHVKKAQGSVLVDFLFPLPIPGLSE